MQITMTMTITRLTRLPAMLALGMFAVVAADQSLSSAIAAEINGSVQCASRDLRLLMSIESHGEAADVSAEKLGEAVLSMMKARAACAAGRVGEALAIYDSVFILHARPQEK